MDDEIKNKLSYKLCLDKRIGIISSLENFEMKLCPFVEHSLLLAIRKFLNGYIRTIEKEDLISLISFLEMT